MIYDRIKLDRKYSSNMEKRSVMGVVMNEITIDGKPMVDNDAIKRLTQLRKASVGNIKLYRERGGRDDSISKEVEFISIVNNYLPMEAGKEDIADAITSLNIENPTMKDMGRVMGHLKKTFGVVDGNLVKSILIK